MKNKPALMSAVALVLSAAFAAAQENPPPDRSLNPPPAEGGPRAEGGARRDGGGRPEGNPARPLAGLFQMLDTNRDGAIDATELAEGVKKFDQNGDGKITPDEFRAAARPAREGDAHRPPGDRPETGRAGGPGEGDRAQRGSEDRGEHGPGPQPPREGPASRPQVPRAGERGDRPPGPPPQAFHRRSSGPSFADAGRRFEQRRPAYGMQAPPPPRAEGGMDRREPGRAFPMPHQIDGGARLDALTPRDPQGPPRFDDRRQGPPLAYRKDFRAHVPQSQPPPRGEWGQRPPPAGPHFQRGPENSGPRMEDLRGREPRPFNHGPDFRGPQDHQRPPGWLEPRGEGDSPNHRPGPPPPPRAYPVDGDEAETALI